jgi:hypothetical protein
MVSRVKREDGLARIVMGLGTRAVDRVGDDFPVLISLGQPDLPVNQTTDEMRKYSPRIMDVIDVENNRFSSIPIAWLVQQYGNNIPYLNNMLSVLKNDLVSDFNKYTVNLKTDEIVTTFNGLIKKTPFVEQIKKMLSLLKEKLDYPVDIEFASDGKTFISFNVVLKAEVKMICLQKFHRIFRIKTLFLPQIDMFQMVKLSELSILFMWTPKSMGTWKNMKTWLVWPMLYVN